MDDELSPYIYIFLGKHTENRRVSTFSVQDNFFSKWMTNYHLTFIFLGKHTENRWVSTFSVQDNFFSKWMTPYLYISWQAH